MTLWILGIAGATTYDVYPSDDLFAVLDGLVAGDEVIVHAGTWSTQQAGGSWFRELDWQGTPTDPITVRVATGDVAVLQGDPAASQNVLNLRGQYWTLQGFEITGGSHGIRLYDTAHVTLEDLHIHDVADVALSANTAGNVYEDVTLRGNHVHHTAGTGECFYLGCNDDACQFHSSLVEGNWCHDTLASTQGDGIEIKTGSYDNIVRNNVIHDVNYPGITMYGAMGRGDNVVEGNLVFRSNDNGIQVVNEVIVRNNIVVDSGNNGIQVKASQGETPHGLTIVNNTVDGASDACLRGNDLDAASDGTIANNALYCPSTNGIRLPVGAGSLAFETNAVAGIDDHGSGLAIDPTAFTDRIAMDYYPAPGATLIDAGTPTAAVTDDYNCLARTSGALDIGAYEVSGPSNPGQTPTTGFKSCASPGTGTGTATGSTPGTTSTGTSTGFAPTGTGTGTTADTSSSDSDDKGCSCATADPPIGWLAFGLPLIALRRRPTGWLPSASPSAPACGRRSRPSPTRRAPSGAPRAPRRSP